jgi:hypothetical protein
MTTPQCFEAGGLARGPSLFRLISSSFLSSKQAQLRERGRRGPFSAGYQESGRWSSRQQNWFMELENFTAKAGQTNLGCSIFPVFRNGHDRLIYGRSQ